MDYERKNVECERHSVARLTNSLRILQSEKMETTVLSTSASARRNKAVNAATNTEQAWCVLQLVVKSGSVGNPQQFLSVKIFSSVSDFHFLQNANLYRKCVKDSRFSHQYRKAQENLHTFCTDARFKKMII